MPEIRPLFDAEALVVQYLAGQADVIALAGPDPVSTDLPRGWRPAPNGDPARIRITKVSGSKEASSPVSHLTRARLQIDAYATESGAAFQLCAVAVARLEVLPTSEFVFPGAVVTAVVTELEPRRNDDQSTDVAAYVAEVILFGHPVGV